MKLKRSRKSKKGRIEIIPMIDVMFFLLATFMLASLSMHRFDSMPVNLTKGEAEKINEDVKITLTIDADNHIFLNKELVDLQSLSQNLKPLLTKFSKTVIVVSDSEAKQGVVSQSMLESRKAGAEHFSIIVQNK
ncbi:MAG: biopolymer transporter ExbD [Rickettsiales bacterium]|nr:biopolymer transporter ExbD [Rickettsiales bacterium]